MFPNDMSGQNKTVAVFGGGCFWCTEAVFEMVRGVTSVMPGYAGGHTPNPTYDQVCTGETGHAEVLRVEYDPSQVSFDNLLTVFFAVHDPTTLNRQGNDVGTQYRSVILYTDDAQKRAAEVFIKRLNEDGKRVVTELVPLGTFFEAEAYHHHYFINHPEKAYCQLVINPKLEKLKEHYKKLLK
jgi:peptide-methionine (S)-S-oxide reductase